ncbi:DsbC family protein [Sphingobium sp. CECT 9361]|uniref:DsbC family protein n=1 Tax=Sphingobium sp. CECT 9361 TaxID=2845384 RepID=UPI001E2CEB15|nr:DsbC family protein [Sphingobium sp. CECT 9361]CAH0354310.1 hypothetical protein SPH9361_02960 [Sphingobium sp. CECT 9361]
MSVINWMRGRIGISIPVFVLMVAPVVGPVSYALAREISGPSDDKVAQLIKARLPKTPLTKVDCNKVGDLCEVTAGANLFYVDRGARYLIIGRVYDMETRQDLTAARLLEINPDMLVGGAAKANAAAAEAPDEAAPEVSAARGGVGRTTLPVRPVELNLTGLPAEGAIVWGNRAARQTVTVFTDFRCSYCRALTNVLRSMDVRVVERPISVLGSRDIADRVYCSKNQEEALHAAYAGEPVKAPGACDTKGLDANEKFAQRHGLSGTPVIVRSDGAMLEGYRPKEFLEAWLKGAKS